MELHGHVQNGAIALDGDPSLPEGAAVTVVIAQPEPQGPASLPATEIVCQPGQLPYVRGGTPGTWQLTSEGLAEILDEEDRAMMKGRLIDPS